MMRSRDKGRALRISIGAACIALAPDVAQAYLDPGTGSMLLSALVSAAVAVGMAAQTYWHKLGSLFRRRAQDPATALDASGPRSASDTGRWRRSWRDLRALRALDADWRRIVFYAESGQDWHHLFPIVTELTGSLRRRVSYVTSDPTDPVFAEKNERLRSFWIPEGLPRIWVFRTLRADVCVLTMMDLGNLQLKRSIHPVHYAYVFHSLGSTHMVDFPGSYDHYDTVLCAGPHQMREIRAREEREGLTPKRLVPHGYARLENLIESARHWPRAHRVDRPPSVVIAPTWGERSILPVCGEPLIEALLSAGFGVTLRPHYQTLRTSSTLIERLRRRFGQDAHFSYIDRMGESASLLDSDLLVSDWSAMAVEYALGLERPVLFIDVPPRVRNPGWADLGLEPLERSIRSRVGAILAPEAVGEAPDAVRKLLADPGDFRARAAALREELVFNPGQSARVGAREIAQLADAVGGE